MIRLTATEEEEQSALFEWVALCAGQYPDLRLLFHVPNGGLRNKVTAQKLKRAGVRPGVPDLLLLVPRAHFHGLAIELKSQHGHTSIDQYLWIGELRAHGYCVVVCRGWEAARDIIVRYLGLGMPGRKEEERGDKDGGLVDENGSPLSARDAWTLAQRLADAQLA